MLKQTLSKVKERREKLFREEGLSLEISALGSVQDDQAGLKHALSRIFGSFSGNDKSNWLSTVFPRDAFVDAPFEVVFGYKGSDNLWGGANADFIVSLEGDDFVHGGKGNDVALGGDDADVLLGAADNDRLFGQQGNDLIFGGQGIDLLSGGDGRDTLVAGTDDDVVFGDRGTDLVLGGAGADVIYAGDGSDDVLAGAGNDTVSGGHGHDTVRGGRGDDSVGGAHGNDSLSGGPGDDTLAGGSGNDTVDGNDGADLIVGDGGADVLVGGGGPDTLLGQSGDDTLHADMHDEVHGGPGDDLALIDGALEEFDVASGSIVLIDRFSGESIRFEDVETFRFVSDSEVEEISADDLEAIGSGTPVQVGGKTVQAPSINVADGTQVLTVNDPDPTVSVVWDRAVQQAVIDTEAVAVGPTIASRAYAMMHTAMYDAWAAFDPTAERVSRDVFQTDPTVGEANGVLDQLAEASPTEAAKEKAMSFAAFTVLNTLFPDMAELFETVLGGRYELNAGDTSSLEARIGIDAANDLLALRIADGANQTNNYEAEGSLSRYATQFGVNSGGPEQEGRDITAWTPEEVPFDSGGPLQPFLTPQWEFVEDFALGQTADGTVNYRLPPAPQPFFGEGFSNSALSLDDKTITLSIADNAAPVSIGGILYGDGAIIPVDENTKEELVTNGVINEVFIAQAEEVVEFSANLTDEHKLIAEFWEDGNGTSFPPGTFMSFGQFVSARDQHSIDDDAKLFLALGNAVMDAGIATWHSKVETDYARPVRAIRDLGELGLLGEKKTIDGVTGYYVEALVPLADPDGDGKFTSPGTGEILATEWTTFQRPGDSSPPFAEYTSGHSAFSAAGAAVLAAFTGSDEFGGSVSFATNASQFEFGVPALETILSWETFSDAALESGLSRLYGGIHFHEGNVNGTTLGYSVGESAFEQARAFWEGTADPSLRPFAAEDHEELHHTARQDVIARTLTAGGTVAFSVDDGVAATGATLTFFDVDDVSGSSASFQVEGFIDGESVGAFVARRAVQEPGGTLNVAFPNQAFDEIVVRDAEGDVSAQVAVTFGSDDFLV